MSSTMRFWLHVLLLWNVSQSMNDFICDNGQIIKREYFCDGRYDCSDKSDEIVTDRRCSNCSDLQVSCHSTENPINLTCAAKKETYCKALLSCHDVDPCDVGCATHYRCQGDASCRPRSTICDGNSCNGCDEDTEWTSGVGFKCVRNGKPCLIPQQLLHDNVKDCDNGEDLCFIKSGSLSILDSSLCFQCFLGGVIIPRNKICDGIIDCPDLSDECLCQGNVPRICNDVILTHPPLRNSSDNNLCEIGQVTCGDGKCLNRSSVCDGTRDCYDGRDEMYEYCRGTLKCSEGTFETINQTCRCDKPCKSLYGVMCDGQGECPVPSERDIQWPDKPGHPIDECTGACYHPDVMKFTCTTPYLLDIPLTDVDFKMIQCQFEIPTPPDMPTMIHYAVVVQDQICDGFVDCLDGQEDEKEDLCPDRFYCKISIERKFVCDFNVNCDDGSDEKNCEGDGRFYCENEKPLFVTERQKFDGRCDCSDWSDECPIKSKPPDHNIFSSRYELIGSPVLRVFVWVMGIFAICGNLCVMFEESKALHRIMKKSDVSASLRTNHILVFNLALADFLMGVYLIILGATGIFYSGIYCANRLNWLSSHTCAVMGILVVISSETSVMTMLMLTIFRLYAVIKPFDSSTRPNAKLVMSLVFFAWIISLLLAILPLLDELHSVFEQSAVIRANPFFANATVDFDSAKLFAEKLVVFDQIPANVTTRFEQVLAAESWQTLMAVVSRHSNHPQYLEATGWLGYYSANSVCIPKLFVTQNVASSSYSFTITLFNFLSFVFVSSAYVAIFMKSKSSSSLHRTRSVKNQKHSKVLQRKIIRLIASDFCCWVPVSIMTFLNMGGIKLPSIAYVISAVILLPVNSSLNPILYSSFMDRYLDKAWSRTRTLKSSLRTNETTLTTKRKLSSTRV
ncbi:uncharacterized protein LOC143444168 isoform X2 [Clavelina lepadiformis]|uniref:uncharacterized protein LOC143444168 isoform X2 n=1 Tax=Clavelina lepadiformis TaxID=159417 RepID=UPI0040415E7D